MGNAEWSLVWVGVITVLVMIYGLYDSGKKRDMDKVDVAQAELIKGITTQVNDLYDKCRENEKATSNIREVIAGEHYKRGEVDRMVDKLDHTCQTGFDNLGKKFDRMVEMLTNHLISDKGGQ